MKTYFCLLTIFLTLLLFGYIDDRLFFMMEWFTFYNVAYKLVFVDFWRCGYEVKIYWTRNITTILWWNCLFIIMRLFEVVFSHFIYSTLTCAMYFYLIKKILTVHIIQTEFVLNRFKSRSKLIGGWKPVQHSSKQTNRRE